MELIKFGEIKLSDLSKKYVNECLESSNITMGEKVKAFEDQFKALFGYKHCVLMSSGTSADQAAFMTLYQSGAHTGDEIIVPALTFVATWTAVRAAGFVPVPVDVKEDLNINVDLIKRKITSKTRAICAVNLMGRPAQLEEIKAICDKYKLILIIDNCEAYGCKYNGRFSLDYGVIETTSHYSAHVMISAEGGCCLTNDEQYDTLLRMIRNHGRIPTSQYFDHPVYGLNFKNTDLHASIGLGEISTFWNDFKQRKNNMDVMTRYCDKYRNIAFMNYLDTQTYYHAPHGFNIVVDHPNYKISRLKMLLDENKIEHKRTFGAFNQHGCMNKYHYPQGSFPVAEWCGDNGITIGVHKFLTKDDLDRVCTTLDKFFQGQ